MRSKNERNGLFGLFLGDDSDRFGTYYISISYLVKYGSSDTFIFKIWNRMRSLENSLDDFGEDPGEICKGRPKFPKKNMSWGSSLKIPEVRQSPQGKPVSFRQELP